MVAQIKGTRRNGRRWDKKNLEDIYNSVKDMFDFYAVSSMRRKYKQFEQQIWETINWK